jgi:hypothetical protein
MPNDGLLEPFRLLVELSQILIPLAIAFPPIISTVHPSPRLRSPILLSWLSIPLMLGLLSIECCRLWVGRALPLPLALFVAVSFLMAACLFPFVGHGLVEYLDVRIEEDRISALRESARDALGAQLSAFLRDRQADPNVCQALAILLRSVVGASRRRR